MFVNHGEIIYYKPTNLYVLNQSLQRTHFDAFFFFLGDGLAVGGGASFFSIGGGNKVGEVRSAFFSSRGYEVAWALKAEAGTVVVG